MSKPKFMGGAKEVSAPMIPVYAPRLQSTYVPHMPAYVAWSGLRTQHDHDACMPWRQGAPLPTLTQAFPQGFVMSVAL